jgi:hypothetical protein
MENYEKKIEEIDLKLEGILSNIGNALRGLGSGLRGVKPEPTTVNTAARERMRMVQSDSEIARKVALGKPELYLIGNNEVFKISDELYPFFQFDLDKDETNNRGVLIYSSNQDKVLKSRPELEWLFNGDYIAQELSISNYTPKLFEPSGAIKNKLINFSGIWQDGSFKGIMTGSGSKILGGRIVDGIFMGEADGFKISPWNFWSGGFSPMKNFVLGMPMAKDNTKYKKLSIFQVPSDRIIKIIDNNDEEHILRVEKGVNYESLDLKINGEKVNWINYTKDKNSFENSFMIIGQNFSISDIGFSIDNGIQSIEIKTSSYSPKTTNSQTITPTSPTNVSSDVNKFDIKTKQPGWTPGGRGYYTLDIDINDNTLVDSIQKFKDDINSGKFFKYLKFLKKIIEEGRVDGYGKFPNLAFLFPKQMGINYKNDDSQRDAVMKYFSDFRENVIDNFASQNITDYYTKLIKNFIEGNITTSKKITKTSTTKPKSSRVTIKEEGLSLSKIVSKIL